MYHQCGRLIWWVLQGCCLVVSVRSCMPAMAGCSRLVARTGGDAAGRRRLLQLQLLVPSVDQSSSVRMRVPNPRSDGSRRVDQSRRDGTRGV